MLSNELASKSLQTDAPPPLDELSSSYRVRFARDRRDLEAAQKLRFEVFNLELDEGLTESYATGRDEDLFDRHCHHLLVEHVATGDTIGTYRLQTLEMASSGSGFYSASEFDLSALPSMVLRDGVELGRACIERHHRKQRVLYLLWRGLACYMLHNRKRFFFGCSSLTSQDQNEGVRALRYLANNGFVHDTVQVKPLPDLACKETTESLAPSDVDLPKLFRTYLRYGARVCGPPAIDRQFGTIDFLILLDLDQLKPQIFRHFAADLPGLSR